MFTFVAATVFFLAFLMAAATIAWMLALYRDKMVAALLFQPIPQEAPVYHIRIRRPRVPGLSHAPVAPRRAPFIAAV